MNSSPGLNLTVSAQQQINNNLTQTNSKTLNLSYQIIPSKTDLVPGEVFFLKIIVTNNENFSIPQVSYTDNLLGQPLDCNDPEVGCDIIRIFNFGDLSPGETKELTYNYKLLESAKIGSTVFNGNAGGIMRTVNNIITSEIKWSVNVVGPSILEVSMCNAVNTLKHSSDFININYTGANFRDGDEFAIRFRNLSDNSDYISPTIIPAKNGNYIFSIQLPPGLPQDKYDVILELTRTFIDANSNIIHVSKTYNNFYYTSVYPEFALPVPNDHFFRKGDTLNFDWYIRTTTPGVKTFSEIWLFDAANQGINLYAGQNTSEVTQSFSYTIPNDFKSGDYYIKIGVDCGCYGPVYIESVASIAIRDALIPTPIPSPISTPTPSPSLTPTPPLLDPAKAPKKKRDDDHKSKKDDDDREQDEHDRDHKKKNCQEDSDDYKNSKSHSKPRKDD